MSNRNYKYLHYKAAKTARETISIMNMDSSKSTVNFNSSLKEESGFAEYIDFVSDRERIEAAVKNYSRKEKSFEAKRLKETLDKLNRVKQTRLLRRRLTSIGVAAAVLFVSFMVWHSNGEKETFLQIATEKIVHNDLEIIKPTLISANDTEVIELEVEDNKLSTIDELATIIKTNQYTETEVAQLNNPIEYNTLKIPSKYTYKLELSDKTVVTLNANSSLRFPIEFTEEERVVYLSGEAYFDVSKSDKPFIVMLENDISVRVYGTEFNINSNNGNSLKTLLVEGSVGVQIGGESVMLAPNDLIDINKNSNNYIIKQVEDTDAYLYWMTNSFVANNDPMEDLLYDVSKWYGVNFTFSDEVDLHKEYIVNIDRFDDINTTIEVLEKALNVQFIRENKDNYSIKLK